MYTSIYIEVETAEEGVTAQTSARLAKENRIYDSSLPREHSSLHVPQPETTSFQHPPSPSTRPTAEG